MNRPGATTICFGLVLSWCLASQGAIVFVDGRVADCGDGQSWATACKYLQDALTAARQSPGTITEIWVAAGTYTPDHDCAHPAGTGNRMATFQLVDGVALRGGFAGTKDSAAFDLADRDFAANTTVLSGDLAGNDGPDCANNGENSCHVMWAEAVGPAAVLDGLTISGGNANLDDTALSRRGGGLYCQGSPTLNRCIFTRNAIGEGWGGGMYSEGNPTLTDCAFIDNIGVAQFVMSDAAGMYCVGDATLIGCEFTGNKTNGTMAYGAGLHLSGNAKVINCIFNANEASDSAYGGGVHIHTGNPMLIGCAFINNSGGRGGGLCTYLSTSAPAPTLVNCTFSGNTGAIYHMGRAACNLQNCVVWDNGPTGIYSQFAGKVVAAYSCIQGGYTGMGNISVDPLFADAAAGDFRPQQGSPCIDAGINSVVPPEILTDLLGHPRFLDDPVSADCRWAPGTCGTAPIADMGAYEYIPVIPGDFDRDGDIDADDTWVFMECHSGPVIPWQGDCFKADLDVDNDVDASDFGLFQRCLSGAGKSGNPYCLAN